MLELFSFGYSINWATTLFKGKLGLGENPVLSLSFARGFSKSQDINFSMRKSYKAPKNKSRCKILLRSYCRFLTALKVHDFIKALSEWDENFINFIFCAQSFYRIGNFECSRLSFGSFIRFSHGKPGILWFRKISMLSTVYRSDL